MSDQLLNINKVAELTGLSPSVLRVWEMRYGWPKPHRHKNSYRKYDAATIDDLKWVKERLATGATIRELVVEGKVTRDRNREVTPDRTRALLDFSSIPQPASEEGRRLRALMEQAVRTGDSGQQTLIEAQAMRLRPSERELVVTAVLRIVQNNA